MTMGVPGIYHARICSAAWTSKLTKEAISLANGTIFTGANDEGRHE